MPSLSKERNGTGDTANANPDNEIERPANAAGREAQILT